MKFSQLSLQHKIFLAFQVGMLENAAATIASFSSEKISPDEVIRWLWEQQQQTPYYSSVQEIEEMMKLWDTKVKSDLPPDD